ncbi:MAG: methyltransferase [Pseudomonadota bacterium]
MRTRFVSLLSPRSTLRLSAVPARLAGVALLVLASACTTVEEPPSAPAAPAPDPYGSLDAVLAAQSAEHQARYAARNPRETLAFFDVRPGMVVAEALPGGGWYSRILAPYLGSNGALYGVNYQDSMWAAFGMPPERVAQRIASTAEFPAKVAEFTDLGPRALGFTFADVPTDVEGTVDRVLFIRALHNLHRFGELGVLDEAIAASHAMLKPDGLVGVVQHWGPESAPDEWANGGAGYLKRSRVIEMFEAAGFVFAGESAVNANPKDQPTTDDFVWRLPPSYAGGEETKAAVDAIGESNRMTLRFRKRG